MSHNFSLSSSHCHHNFCSCGCIIPLAPPWDQKTVSQRLPLHHWCAPIERNPWWLVSWRDEPFIAGLEELVEKRSSSSSITVDCQIFSPYTRLPKDWYKVIQEQRGYLPSQLSAVSLRNSVHVLLYKSFRIDLLNRFFPLLISSTPPSS